MQAFNPRPEIIDLGSDSEDSEFPIEDFLTPEANFERDDHDPETFPFARIPDPLHSEAVQRDARTQYKVCLTEVLEVFPDISHDHVRNLYEAWIQANEPRVSIQEQSLSNELTIQILDAGKYPKEKDRINELKRKRSQALNSEEEEEVQWKDAKRELDTCVYNGEARVILQEEFVHVPSRFIDATLKENGHFFASYLALELAEYTYLDSKDPPYIRLKAPRKTKPTALARLEEMEAKGYAVQELKKELLAARNRRKKVEIKRQVEKDLAAAEAATEQEYRNNGDVLECQCCYDLYPLNKLTHCDGDELHFFCLECAETYAKNEIGNQRYELTCMAGGDCTALFSRDQKLRFLDASSFEAIERIQQQAELRLAELTNLAACPFCDFAAICPPITIDKEFRCRNPECEKVSCRECKLDSHLPLTCLESKKENGVSERHVLEEARTEALLRTCPKCNVKIIKEDGCNKVVCPCGGLLCDFCGKDISKVGYVHFDGATGDPGNKCPTYDNSHVRRNKEIEKAEAAALKQVRAENPNLTAEDLKINFKEAVKSPPKPYHNPMLPPPLFGIPNRPGFPDGRGIPVAPPGFYAPPPPDLQRIPGIVAMNNYPGAFQPGGMIPPMNHDLNALRQDIENMRRVFDGRHATRMERLGGRDQRARNEAANIDEQIRLAQAEVTRRAQARFNEINDAHMRRPDVGMDDAGLRALRPGVIGIGNHQNRYNPDGRNTAARDLEVPVFLGHGRRVERNRDQKNGGMEEQRVGQRERRRDGL